MRKVLNLASAVSAILIGLSCAPNAMSATSCEDALSSSYQCSYVADDHTSGQFLATVTNPVMGDGLFDLLIGGVYLHHCTCNESGPPSAPTFGRGKKSFICNQGTTGTMGTARKGKIVGETYNTAGVGQRTVYVCSTGKPPPPPPALAGYCCELPFSALAVDDPVCTQTLDPAFPCSVRIANEACSGKGTCSPKPKPGPCCDLTAQAGPIPCLQDISATTCSSPTGSPALNGIFHDKAICTVNGCVP